LLRLFCCRLRAIRSFQEIPATAADNTDYCNRANLFGFFEHIMRVGYSVSSSPLFGKALSVQQTTVGVLFVTYNYLLVFAALLSCYFLPAGLQRAAPPDHLGFHCNRLSIVLASSRLRFLREQASICQSLPSTFPEG
jgi:hypothetical protein